MKILSKRAREKSKIIDQVEVSIISVNEFIQEYEETYSVGYRGKSEIDAGFFFAPYTPLLTYPVKRSTERRVFYVDTTPIQKSVYPKLSVIRERGIDNRFGRTGDR